MGRVDPDLVDHGLAAKLWQHVASHAADADLRTYYGPDSTYDGRRYDELGDGDPDRFTAEDVVAVSSLSVQIPITYSWRLLRDDADSLNELLRQVPRQLDLWDAGDGVVGPGSPADRLWQCLKSFGKHGGDDGDAWVTAGKLLARKRPRLIPIYDNRVRDLVAVKPRCAN